MTTDQLIDSPDSAIAVRAETPLAQQEQEIPSEPTIGYIICRAMERGMDAASIATLAGLYREEQAARQERAITKAIAECKAECGRILKDKAAVDTKKTDNQGNPKELYKYADLETITKRIDPFMDKYGLSKTWDCETVEGSVLTTCTVHHVDGGKRSSRFSCSWSAGGTFMNGAQALASATTFGRRYSLTGALGITTDKDDDGRTAHPNPAPKHDETAPKTTGREQGHKPIPPKQEVTKEQLGELCAMWKNVKKPEGSKTEMADKFFYFVDSTLGYTEPSKRRWFEAMTWKAVEFEKCLKALEVQP